MPEITERLREFLEKSAGVAVVSTKTLGLLGGIASVNEAEILELIRGADHPDAEGVVVANTNLTTLHAVTPLERELGKPVVTANQPPCGMPAARRGLRGPKVLVDYGSGARKRGIP